MSKSFGMPGWRVGYVAHPKILTSSLRKIQDTIPTHCSIVSQRLGELCYEENDEYRSTHDGVSWVDAQVSSLEQIRDKIWSIVEPLGTVKTFGAFYFLVKLPAEVTNLAHALLIMNDEYA